MFNLKLDKVNVNNLNSYGRATLRNEARKKLQNHWGYVALATIIYFILRALFIGHNKFTFTAAPMFLENLLLAIIAGSLSMGFYAMSQAIDSNDDQYYFKENSFVDCFLTAFQNRYVTLSIVTFALRFFYTFLWSCLFLIPGIVKGYAYSLTTFILKDLIDQNPDSKRQISFNEAITMSRVIMYGHKWDLFVLNLSFIGWGILSALTCGIGFIFLIPYMTMTRIEFYKLLKKQPEVRDLIAKHANNAKDEKVSDTETKTEAKSESKADSEDVESANTESNEATATEKAETKKDENAKSDKKEDAFITLDTTPNLDKADDKSPLKPNDHIVD